MKPQPKQPPSEKAPLKVGLPFDDAIARAFKVKPPSGGWAAYEVKLKAERANRRKLKEAD